MMDIGQIACDSRDRVVKILFDRAQVVVDDVLQWRHKSRCVRGAGSDV